MPHAKRWNRFSLALRRVPLVRVALSPLWVPLAVQAASVSVSPASGAANRVVQLSSSGFDLDGIGLNTGFYVDGAFFGRCPDDARANCTVALAVPASTPGSHTIAARNSNGEQAETTFTVASPQLFVGPACAGPGSPVSLSGRFFAVGADAGVSLDGNLLANGNFPDANGSFAGQVTIPPNTPEGEYVLSVTNSFGQSESKTLTITPACVVVGHVTDLKGGGLERQLGDGSWAPLAVGDPIHQSDHLRTPPDGGGRVLFDDQTEFTLGRNSRMDVDDFDFEPQTHQGRSFFSLLQGAFVYTSGLIGKQPEPENVQLNTAVGCLGIRGTALYLRVDPQTGQVDVDLVHGPISVTPAMSGLKTLQTDGDSITLANGALVAVPEPGLWLSLGASVTFAGLVTASSRARRDPRGARP